jgi:predicted ABC-type exoprotein transport system permease subunit
MQPKSYDSYLQYILDTESQFQATIHIFPVIKMFICWMTAIAKDAATNVVVVVIVVVVWLLLFISALRGYSGGLPTLTGALIAG